MKILVLGGDGMLGHQIYQHLCINHEVRVTLRKNISAYSAFNIFKNEHCLFEIDAYRLDDIFDILADFKPDAVINCIGIVKQRPTAKETIPSLEINSIFPLRLAALCNIGGARMIHFSTDCVFSGKRGNYDETDLSDADDLYGKSKFLGEVGNDNSLTLRTSIIGKELSRKTGLLEWFLAQKDTIKGYKNAVFSGFTTLEMSRIIEMLLVEYPEASGIYHVASEPINKYELLSLIKEKMCLPVAIIPDESFRCDRSLNSERFRKTFNYQPPSWQQMIDELCNELSTTKS